VRRRIPVWLRRTARWAHVGLVAGIGVVSYTWITLPDVRPLRTQPPEQTAFMALRVRQAEADGKEPRTVKTWVNYGRISPSLKRAVIVAEDAAFWQHEGIDLDEIRASMEVNWMRGSFLRGGSTITQQLAKNLYLSPSRNPYRKFKELLITRRLEVELTKARIFELYLNLIEWGDGIWGAEAASRAYFGHSAASLSAEQAALLAGAIINPRVYSPARPNARLLRRQKIILGRMGGVPVPSAPAAPAEPAVPSADLPISTGVPDVLKVPPPAGGGS
jgi:monofunctional biosynthetic peptidoglycan transglycosylase